MASGMRVVARRSIEHLTTGHCCLAGQVDEESNEGEQDTQMYCEKRDILASSINRAVLIAAFFIMAVLLTSCALTSNDATVVPTLTPTVDPVMMGRQAYLRVCAVCHGQNAEGYANALGAPALDETEHAYEHPDPVIHDWIVNGKLGLGRQMPAMGSQLTDAEVHAIIAYLHSLWTEEQLEIQQSITARYPATPEPTWTAEP